MGGKKVKTHHKAQNQTSDMGMKLTLMREIHWFIVYRRYRRSSSRRRRRRRRRRWSRGAKGGQEEVSAIEEPLRCAVLRRAGKINRDIYFSTSQARTTNLRFPGSIDSARAPRSPPRGRSPSPRHWANLFSPPSFYLYFFFGVLAAAVVVASSSALFRAEWWGDP